MLLCSMLLVFLLCIFFADTRLYRSTLYLYRISESQLLILVRDCQLCDDGIRALVREAVKINRRQHHFEHRYRPFI